MKQLRNSLLLLTFVLITNASFGQAFAAVKKFDYSLLENKVLYIPSYETSKKYIAKMSKKGKFDKIADAKARVEAYNTAWKEAMAESSYDATDYEIKGFVARDLIKKKDPKAIILSYEFDDFGNMLAGLLVTGPKKKYIARSLINGLDLEDKNDIRLMINLLNESLVTASEIQEEGNKASLKNQRSKYKVALVEWAEDIENKTFLVPESTHKKENKRKERNADLKEALKTWKLSKYDFTTEEKIDELRLEGDENSYYWRSMRVYTNSSLIILNYNFILSTEGDDLIVAFMGKKRLKPATLELIQTKITSKVERYKKQLNM